LIFESPLVSGSQATAEAETGWTMVSFCVRHPQIFDARHVMVTPRRPLPCEPKAQREFRQCRRLLLPKGSPIWPPTNLERPKHEL
jgi:hypothetical protein